MELEVVKLKNIKDNNQLNRIGAHSHIHGLGLNNKLKPKDNLDGMVGQKKARRASGIICKMIKEGKIAGRGILLTGQPGTGKTALAMAIAKNLGTDTPFTSISGSEVYSLEMNKTEALTQSLRKSIGIKIKEETDLIEGEVVELQIERLTDGKNKNTGKIIMKTTDMETIYEIGNKLIEQLTIQNIVSGDIININKASGKVVKLGKSFTKSHEYDAIGPKMKFVHCPNGEIQKHKKIEQTVTLHEIDVINSKPQGFLTLFSGDTGEISTEIREQINIKLNVWKKEGKATIKPGVLFIDEVHMLDIECYSFLNRALENDLAPIIILATNRGITKIRGTQEKSAHGLPVDLLDRLLIIETSPYSIVELHEIIKLRVEEEDCEIKGTAMKMLVKLASETSLRYAINLITPAFFVAKKRNSSIIELFDIQRVYELFIDLQRSTQFLNEYKNRFIFHKK